MDNLFYADIMLTNRITENSPQLPIVNSTGVAEKNNRISIFGALSNDAIPFQYNIQSASNTEKQPAKKANLQYNTQTDAPKIAFTGDKLFNHPSIIVKKSFSHKIQEKEDLISIAKKYEIDTYQLIVANPQLKENVDYIVRYPENGLSEIESNLIAGQNITIPARYSVKSGSCMNLRDVAKITGVSEAYLKDFLTKIEVKNADGRPDLTAYIDAGGTPTIGYGHTGKFKGKPLSCEKGKETKITYYEALELMAEDLLKHKAMTIAYLGKENYQKAPKSVQNTILDIAYNKGIWDGYLTTRGYAESTKKIKEDLKKGDFTSALVHSKREKTGFRGLRKRNIYRFISGLTDLAPEQRAAAMKAMKPYYEKVLNQCKAYDKPALRKAWNDAERGVTTGYNIK